MSDDLAAATDVDRPLLALLWRHGRPDAHYLVVGVLLQVAKSFVGFADVFVVGLAIDALFNDRPFALPFVPDAWVPTEPLALLAFAAGVVAAINVATILGGSLSDVGFGVFAQRLLHRVRVHAFDATQHRTLAALDEHRTGDVMSALNDDVNQLETFFTVLLGAAVWIGVTLVAAVVYMGVLNAQLALVVLASAPVVAGVNYWYARRLDPLQADVRAERGALNAHLEAGLGGVDVVKAYTAEDHEHERVADASATHLEARLRARLRAIQQAPVNRLVAGAWLLATLAIGGVWVLDGPPLFFTGTLTAGQLVPFLFYLERATLPLKNLSGVVNGYHASNAAARRIVGLTAGPGDTPGEDADGDPTPGATVDGAVRLEDVSYRYPDADRRALDGVTLDVDPGETIGVVGATGAGKSTLVRLLLRLDDPESGTVRVDGTDLRGVDPRSHRAAVGYVGQDAYLFNTTVRENIAYGATGEVSDARIRDAARAAGVHDELLALPDGYDTVVGDEGGALSGGQRQRVAIARAVVGDPAVLVLDEATSHVDTETERVVRRHLDDLTADRTTFVVAHRLATVRDADRIVVLDDGRVVETGTHEELVERDGRYAGLWGVQVGRVDAAAD